MHNGPAPIEEDVTVSLATNHAALSFLCLVLIAPFAAAQSDDRLLGTWIGISEDNEGDRVTVERAAVIIDGERLPLRFVSHGVVAIGPRGEEERLRYEIRGDTLTIDDSGETSMWRRVGPKPTLPPVDKPGDHTNPRGEADVDAGGGQSPGPLDDPSLRRVVLTKHTLVDRGSGNMKSHTLLAPKGWKVEGGAWWANTSFFNVLPSRDIKITAPDGRQIYLAPSITAKDVQPSPQFGQPRPKEGTADQGLPIVYMPASLEEWQRWIETRAVPETYKAATNIRVRKPVVVPEFTALLNRQIEPLRQQLAHQRALNTSMGMQQSIDASFLAVECQYTHEGRDWEILFLFGVTYQVLESRELGRQVFWAIDPSVSYRAPAGELEANMPLLAAIANTVRQTPEWTKMSLDHQAKMNSIARRGAADRSTIIANANNEISDIIHQGYKQRNAITDQTHRMVINAIRGTNDYVVAGGREPVQLPSGYEKVYTNGNGEFLLTNDVLYDPNTDPDVNSLQWNTMQVRH